MTLLHVRSFNIACRQQRSVTPDNDIKYSACIDSSPRTITGAYDGPCDVDCEPDMTQSVSGDVVEDSG